MKNKLKYFLQKLLGFKNYLLWFSKFKILTLRWDKNENHFFHFLSLLPNNGVILDVGANIGIMTAWLAKKKPNAQIISFEPIKENFEVLSQIVTDNNFTNVTLKNVAVGKENGMLTMIMPLINNAKQQGLSHVYNPKEKYNYDGIKYTVAVETLDSILEKTEKPIVGIKMDVENFEFEVLLGTQNIIKEFKPIMYLELWDNENRINCFNLMKQLNYKTMVLVNQKLEIYKTQKSQNFFFIPGSN